MSKFTSIPGCPVYDADTLVQEGPTGSVRCDGTLCGDANCDAWVMYPLRPAGLAEPAPIEEHAFNRAVRETDDKRAEICSDRGGEYEDSWALENVSTPVFDSTLRAITDCRRGWGEMQTPREFADCLSNAEKRLLIVAALCDVKISRYGGPFKDDTPIDLANYLMAHATWMNEYLGRG